MQGYTYFFPIAYSATDVAIYQQDVVIHRSEGTSYEETVGSLRIWHIYVGEHCREDYGDIRFVNSTGAALAYYLWPDYDSSSARFCVRLEGADATGVLQVWYGNPAAATTSDSAKNIYDWYSDSPDDWGSGIPYVSGISGTGSMDSAGGIHIKSTNTRGMSWPTASEVNPTGKRIEYLMTDLSSNGDINAQFRFQIVDSTAPDPGTSNGVYQARSDNGCYFGINSAAVPTALTFDAATSRKFAFTATANAKLWIDNVLKLTLSNSAPNYSGKYLRLWVYGHGEATISYVLVRAYSATPPAAIAFGPERASGNLHHVVFGSANMMVI